MPINRLQVGGANPSPDRQDYNLVAGTNVTITAADDATNNVSKATIALASNPSTGNLTATALTVTAPGAVNLGEATVTQITSITTGVTINAASGVITTVSATTAAGATSTFTVTNSAVTASSVIGLAFNYAGTFATNGFPGVQIGTVAGGSFQVVITNAHGANALAGVLKIHFIVA